MSVDYYVHTTKSDKYLYLRTRCPEMVCVKSKSVSSEIFFMPLGSHHNFGMLVFKKPKDKTFDHPTDLFNYCKVITETMQETETKISGGLYVPCFKVSCENSKLDLLHGLPVDQERTRFIQDTVYTSSITLKGAKPNAACLNFSPDDNSYVIDEDYIFVITHPELEDTVKIPFVCALVSKTDWMKA